MEFLLDAVVQDTLARTTVVGLLISFIIVSGVALRKRWIVLGSYHEEKVEDLKEAKKQIDKLQNRIEVMEAMAWRGTHLARRGTETAEYYVQERHPHEPQG